MPFTTYWSLLSCSASSGLQVFTLAASRRREPLLSSSQQRPENVLRGNTLTRLEASVGGGHCAHAYSHVDSASVGPTNLFCGRTGSVTCRGCEVFALGVGSNRLGGFDFSPKKQTLVEARLASTQTCCSVTAD